MQKNNNDISIANVPIQEIAEKYGTPLFIYDAEKIRNNFRRVKNAFQSRYDNFHLYYAIKANNNLALAQILINECAGIDAASVNEIKMAEKLGLKKEEIIFSGNYLSDEDLRQGLETGVIFNLDDISLLPRLLKIGKPNILSFRVNPGIGKSNVGHYTVTAGKDAKFGIEQDQILEAYKQAKDAGIERFGIHMMTGSCVTDEQYFQEITIRMMDIIGELSKKLDINFEFIDLGGGLGIPYTEDENELDIDKTAELVISTINEKIEEYSLNSPMICMEPARYFIGNAGYLLGEIHAIKEKSHQTIYGSDIGMNLVPRVILYDAFHKVHVDGKSESLEDSTNLTGQICEQTDLWGKNLNIPNPEVEDLILIENCGAYCYGMSYSYNGRLRPAEILVDKGQTHIIRQSETLEDIIDKVNIPQHLIT